MTNIKELSEIISKLSRSEDVEKFLDEMLTEKEKKDLVLRWELLKRLNDGIPQRNIASDLKISLCKITRGSRILKSDESIAGKILKSLKE